MVKKLIAGAVVLLIVIVYLIYPAALVAYDEDFNDMSEFKADLDALAEADENDDGENDYIIRSIIASPTVINNNQVKPKDSLLIMTGVEKRLDKAEVDSVANFVAAGGKLILADDYGFANDLSKRYGVTFYNEQFYELESYDINSNYTVAEAYIGTDRGSTRVYDESREIFLVEGEPDRMWDDDDDGDLKTDEDPGDLDDTNDEDDSSDDDYDNAIRTSDGRDNDGDGLIDEPFEGIDEDGLDDDGDWRARDDEGRIYHDVGMDGIGPWTLAGTPNELWPGPDYGEGNGLPDKGEPGVNEETLNGKDDDGDGLVDEDLRTYRLVMYKPTGLLTTNKSYIISHGTHNSYVDLNGDGRITIASEEIFDSGENVDKPSFPGNEIRLIVQVTVDPDGKVVDPVSGKTNPEGDGPTYTAEDMVDFGRIVFVASSSLFTNDLYHLNHMTLTTDDKNPYGYGVPVLGRDSPESYFDEMANEGRGQQIEKDKDGNPDTPIRDDDGNGLLDNTPDYDDNGDPIPDYDNSEFLMTLVYFLLPPPGEGEEPHKILFDESRHGFDSVWLVPVYDTLSTIVFLTSDVYYSLTITISLVILFAFAWIFTKEKENWIHKYDLSTFRGRKTIPNTQKLQSTRVRRALLEKLRMQRGLSPEEFQALPPGSLASMISDPELRELLEYQDRLYPPERVRVFIDKISRIGA
jgi:hypothetical protein